MINKPFRALWICQGCRQAVRHSLNKITLPRTQMSRFTSAGSVNDIDIENEDIPTFAPKRAIPTQHIRENVELYANNCLERNYKHEASYPAKIKDLLDKSYAIEVATKELNARQKKIMKRSKSSASAFTGLNEDAIKELQHLKKEKNQNENMLGELKNLIKNYALMLPNTTHPDTPRGSEPVVLRYLNDHLLPSDKSKDSTDGTNSPSLVPKSHVDIGRELNLLDFTSATTTTGWGWYFLLNEAVLLEQALVQYALDTALKRGWTLVSPPSIVYSHIASACGFRPRDQNGEQQIYTLTDPKSALKEDSLELRASLCLTGTAEIPLAAMFANTSHPQSTFPRKMIGVSRCYRAEAGARGAATKGLYRVHEFTKVELFAWCVGDPEVSDHIYNEMISLQEEILTSLNLPCRVLNMPTQDLGASAHRKVDIEAFMPSRINVGDTQGWGEVTSVSECTDYQARRLSAKYRMANKSSKYLWSLNGTAVAVPRVLLALLEHGWDEQKEEVVIPEVLRKWMGGIEAIRKKS